LSGRVRAIIRDVEWSANEIMQYLLTEYRGNKPVDVVVPDVEVAKK
jgi:biopolymer transport protein ExbB